MSDLHSIIKLRQIMSPCKLLARRLLSAFGLLLLCASPVMGGEEKSTLEVENPALQHDHAIRELQRALGDAAWLDLSTSPSRSKFFRELEKPQGLLEELMFSGPLPDDPHQMLRVAEALWQADAKALENRHELTTAAAVALTFGASTWPEDQAMVRYAYFRDSRLKRLLHPVFDDLKTWEKRFVIAVSGNGKWQGDEGWGDGTLVWLRDHVKLPVSAYIDACWQAPYRLNNVFGDSIHGKKYYTPFIAMNHAERVREVGGVCGSLSHYGASAARANGIPAVTMGEPGHCAYAVRLAPGQWTAAYSLSWQRVVHTSLWGKTWTQLVLQDEAFRDGDAIRRSTVAHWQARASRDSDPDVADVAYCTALRDQPLNHPVWLEYADWIVSKRQLPLAELKAFEKSAISALADFPEAAWDVLRITQPRIVSLIPADELVPHLLEFHKAIATRKGPGMWEFEKALAEQAGTLGGDLAKELEFFTQVVAIQSRSENWFTPAVAWGQARFNQNGNNSAAFINALTSGISPDSGGTKPEGMAAALAPVILASAKAGNIKTFQILSKLAGEIPPPFPPTAPFPGDLLSAGGLLKTSSTSRYDNPGLHAGALEASGGFLHTAAEVRPWVIVQLPKLGELSGIVIVDNGNGYRERQIPIKVSISENGSQWTEVARADKAAGSYRFPLDGKATRVGFVKVERDDDRNEVFRLHAIQIFGRRLQ